MTEKPKTTEAPAEAPTEPPLPLEMALSAWVTQHLAPIRAKAHEAKRAILSLERKHFATVLDALYPEGLPHKLKTTSMWKAMGDELAALDATVYHTGTTIMIPVPLALRLESEAAEIREGSELIRPLMTRLLTSIRSKVKAKNPRGPSPLKLPDELVLGAGVITDTRGTEIVVYGPASYLSELGKAFKGDKEASDKKIRIRRLACATFSKPDAQNNEEAVQFLRLKIHDVNLEMARRRDEA